MNTVCPYFNQGLFIGARPNGGSELSMCCWQQKTNTEIISYDHDYLKNIRQTAVTEFPSQCSPYCNIPGHIANERERSLTEWTSIMSSDTTTKKITTLHLEQNLTCNLTCISCSSWFSSAWNKDYHLFDASADKITASKFPEEKWKDLDLTQLKRLHFTGGEPLLNRDNKKILKHLDNIGVLNKIYISYNTNGTIIPDSETLELWKKSRFIRLFFSLDGVGSVFEYTRYPANWQEVQQNINYFRSLQDICILIEINAIVGIHNVFSLGEFFNWWQQHCTTGSQGDPSSIFVRKIEPSSHGGRVLDLKHLTKNQATQAVSVLQSMLQYPGVDDIIKYIKNHSLPNNDWLDYFIKLDSLRGTNWQKSLSEQLKEGNA